MNEKIFVFRLARRRLAAVLLAPLLYNICLSLAYNPWDSGEEIGIRLLELGFAFIVLRRIVVIIFGKEVFEVGSSHLVRTRKVVWSLRKQRFDLSEIKHAHFIDKSDYMPDTRIHLGVLIKMWVEELKSLLIGDILGISYDCRFHFTYHDQGFSYVRSAQEGELKEFKDSMAYVPT